MRYNIGGTIEGNKEGLHDVWSQVHGRIKLPSTAMRKILREKTIKPPAVYYSQ